VVLICQGMKVRGKKIVAQASRRVADFIEKASLVRGFAANELVRKARNLAMRHRLKIPRELKRRYCVHCYAYLVPGSNCRVRIRLNKVVYYCLSCKKFMRFVHLPRRTRD